MKKLIFSFFIIGLAVILNVKYTQAISLPRNDIVQLKIINNTGAEGYFGICNKPIDPDHKSLCDIPQKITKGENIIYITFFKPAYPVFTTLDESAYTCGTKEKPTTQLPMVITRSGENQLVLNSFIKNEKGEIISILCAQ